MAPIGAKNVGAKQDEVWNFGPIRLVIYTVESGANISQKAVTFVTE